MANAARPDEACLSLRGLTVVAVATGRRLLNDVSLDIFDRESLGIRGPSGSGKTTLARSIAGVLSREVRVVSGEIHFGGTRLDVDVEKRPRAVRGGQISILFQEPRGSFNPLYRVGDQIVSFVKISRPDLADETSIRKRAAEVLEEAGFTDIERILGSRPPELSSGQLQRCALVAAMICEPRLLVADEPTSSLDAASRQQVVAMLRKLARAAGTSLLVISHDVGALGALMDRTLTLIDGELRPEDSDGKPTPYVVSPAVSPHGGEPPLRLRVRGLSKRFSSAPDRKGIQVLDRLDLDLDAGEVLGISGPSGSGKTTLAKCLMNLFPADAGSIELAGTPIRRNEATQSIVRRGMALVWQDPFASLDSRRTIAQQLRDTIRSRAGVDASGEEVRRYLDMARFPEDLLQRRTLQLSGGQAQRASIARALAARPTVLIADEPFAYLNPRLRESIAAELRNWCARNGHSLLLISHDVEGLNRTCDRCLELVEGRLRPVDAKEST